MQKNICQCEAKIIDCFKYKFGELKMITLSINNQDCQYHNNNDNKDRDAAVKEN